MYSLHFYISLIECGFNSLLCVCVLIFYKFGHQKSSYEKWMDGEIQAPLSTFATEEMIINNLVYLIISDKLSELNVGHMLKRICAKFKQHDLKRDYKNLKVYKSRSGSDHRTTSHTLSASAEYIFFEWGASANHTD